MLLKEAARLGGAGDFRLADLHLPLYDGDLEAEGIPESVTALGEHRRGRRGADLEPRNTTRA